MRLFKSGSDIANGISTWGTPRLSRVPFDSLIPRTNAPDFENGLLRNATTGDTRWSSMLLGSFRVGSSGKHLYSRQPFSRAWILPNELRKSDSVASSGD